MIGEEEDSFEHTLLVVREVNVYRVPPRSTSGGWKCADWLVSSKIWSGRLRVVSLKDDCEIRLEDLNSGELFATCRVLAGQKAACVESAVDSSRYFVLKIDDGRGRHAFIGLGFNERNEAFDFNVALTDHEKHVLNEKDKPKEPEPSAAASTSSFIPSANFKLKEGETIRINVKPKSDHKPGLGLTGLGSASGGSLKPLAPPPGGGGGLRLAPPPGSGGMKLAPPPSGAPAAPVQAFGQPAQSSALTGSTPPQSSGPGKQQSGSSSEAPGWTSF